MIVEHLTLFEKMRDPLPFVVFNSLERKNDPCKSDSPTMYLLEKNRDTLPSIMFTSSERKDEPCNNSLERIREEEQPM